MSQEIVSRKEASAGQWSRQSSRPLNDLLLTIVDVGLAGVLLFAPWFMGGRHPLGQLVLISVSIAVATAWVTRQAISRGQTVWKISGCELLLLAAIGLVILQLTPLPSNLIQALSPRLATLLPLWMPGTQPPDALGTWNQLSLTPNATQAGLAMLLCYGLLFLVTMQRIETVDDVEKLLRWFAISAILLATVGLFQYLTSNGKFLWIYTHPFRDTHDAVKGPFINKNHFAHLLALGLGPLIWSVQRALNRLQSTRNPSFANSGAAAGDLEWLVMVQTIGLGVVLFAGLMTLSRGGAIAMCAALVVSGGLLYRIKAVSGRFLAVFGFVTLLIAAALAIHGYQRVTERLDDFTAGNVEELDTAGYRRQLWKADLAASRDFATVGTGIGSHSDVYRMYLPHSWDVTMTHAENGYLQVALEAGLPGLTLLLTGIGLAIYWCFQSLRSTKDQRNYVAAVAVASGIAASVLHSWVDFVWYISSCMAATVLLLACACRLMELSRDGRERWVWFRWNISRPSLAISVAVLLMVGGWMINNRFRATMASPHWDKYLAFKCSPENPDGNAIPTDEILQELETALRWTPEDALMHARFAALACRRFEHLQTDAENPMSIWHIGDAARQSLFASRADLDNWLKRSVGPHRQYMDKALLHARQALSLSPLQGEAYMYLVDLCFLENAVPETKRAYLEQASIVWPYDARVLIMLGRESLLVGNDELCIRYWKRAFDHDVDARALLISTAANHGMRAPDFLKEFKPGWPEIDLVYKTYAKNSNPGEVRILQEQYLAAANAALPKLSRAAAADAYYKVYHVLAVTGVDDQSLDCIRLAVEASPNNLAYRHTYANALRQIGDYGEAEKQLNWCLQRDPSNRDFKQALSEVVKLRIDNGSRSASRASSVN